MSDDNIAPTDRELTPLWFKIGCLSFGGPAAQLAMLQDELVDRRGWIDQRSFLNALNFCMLLPGPEAQQLATWAGYRLGGWRGAITAGGLFILPGALVMLGLAWVAAAYGATYPPVQAIFNGLLIVVVALVIHALWRIGRKTLRSWTGFAIGLGAFLALLAGVGYIWVVAAAIAFGIIASRFGLDLAPEVPAGEGPPPPSGSFKRLGVLTVVFAVLWAIPVASVLLVFGTDPFVDIATLFTKAAFVTFGGAYAVLPYISQAGVEQYGWLSTASMAQGLALAETTPGPLILVTEYIGFMAGWNRSGVAGLTPFTGGLVGALLTLWCTFLPCFYFVLAGAPFLDRLTHDRRASAALAAVTCAVVGAIAFLAVTIVQTAIWPGGVLDPVALVLAALGLLALFKFRVGQIALVIAGAAMGLLRWALGF